MKRLILKLQSILGHRRLGLIPSNGLEGKIPEAFLVGAGVSEQLHSYIHSLGRAPFDYYTCFISYSSHDQHFVEILYRDLRKAGVLCWFASEDLNAGDKFPAEITEAVQSREKLLVVLSKSSLKSDWVRKEVQLARQKEGNGNREVLLPIRLDSAISSSTVDWAIAIRKRRHITDFQNWQQPSRLPEDA